jgi:AcrR family transcriptional regulator
MQLADLAAAAGITTPALYRYFRDRRDLVLATLRHQVEEFRTETADAEARSGPPSERVAEFFAMQQKYLERTAPGAVRFLLQSILGAVGDADMDAAVTPAATDASRYFRAALDDEDVAALCAAVAAGVSFLHATERLEVPPSAVYAALVDLIDARAHR